MFEWRRLQPVEFARLKAGAILQPSPIACPSKLPKAKNLRRATPSRKIPYCTT
jgi:hypothetical protein